jgi:nucleoid-associated protein YgaU
MPVGKKLMVVASVLATGVGTALFFRKDASQTTQTQAGLEEFPFDQRVERRVPGTVKGRPGLLAGSNTRVAPAWRVPVAAPAAITDRPKAVDSPPVVQRSLNPVGALLAPIETVDDPPAEPEPQVEEGSFVPERPAPREHVIVDGDTLAQLAEQYLGDANLYLEIFEFNQATLSTPDLLPIGTVLKIPPRPARLRSEQNVPPQETEGAVEPAPPIVPVEPLQGESSEPAGD